MSNVVNLSAFRRKKQAEQKNEKPEEVETLEQIAERNQKNVERVKRDRHHLNNGVKKSYRLKSNNSTDEEFI